MANGTTPTAKPRPIKPVGIRALAAVLWTFALAGGLFGLDHLLFGSRLSQGWRSATAPVALGDVRHPRLVPPYLPASLSWPPTQIHYRQERPTRFWYGLRGLASDDVLLWIGNDERPPQSLGELRRCMLAAPQKRCPEDWHHLSTRWGDSTLYLLGRFPPAEMARVLRGLGSDSKR